MIRSSPKSIRAPATRSTPSPCTRRRRALCQKAACMALQDYRLHRPRRDGRADLPQPGEEERHAGPRVRCCRRAAAAAARGRRRGRGLGCGCRRQSEIVFLCLPSAKHVRAVFEGDGILKNIRKRQLVVDLGTSSVSQTRDFAGQLQAKARRGWTRRSRARGRRRRTARSVSWSAVRASSMTRSSP